MFIIKIQGQRVHLSRGPVETRTGENTVDGRNPAPDEIWMAKVFFHQQYIYPYMLDILKGSGSMLAWGRMLNDVYNIRFAKGFH